MRVHLYRCYWFRRWGFGLGAIPMIARLCAGASAVYIHGIATWPTTLAAISCVLLRKRFIVAPRGGLMPDYVTLVKRNKRHKWWYYRLLTLPTLRHAAVIHCTSDLEARGVHDLLGGDPPTVTIPNGLHSRDYRVLPRAQGPGLKLCFLGHIQREKGINRFAELWLDERGENDRLIVAGRGTDVVYLAGFRRLLARAGDAIRYRGYVGRDAVVEILAESDFLVLPSGLEPGGGLRENFGNVVLEAMAAGRPVLVTRGLPWDQVEARGAGLVFDPTESSIREVLGRARELGAAEWTVMSREARAYAQEAFEVDRLAGRLWGRLVDWRSDSPALT